MHSPLPDSSALEAGIREDDRPSRISRVQDDVRNLLRTSVFGSVASSPKTPPPGPRPRQPSPERRSFMNTERTLGPEILPSPALAATTSSVLSTPSHPAVHSATNDAPDSYRQMVQHMAHQSALFNSRAVEALNHPDLSDPSLEELDQQKAQQRERRALRRACKRQRRVIRNASRAQVLLCVLAAVLLASLVATYLALVTTSSSSISTTFHVLFILGILLATVLFAHTVARLCVLPSSRSRQRHRNRSPRWYMSGAIARPRRHHRHHNHRRREIPDHATNAYIPPTPIQVHFASDTPSPVEPEAAAVADAVATTTAEEQGEGVWDKDIPAVANPPPAYGRWRGSVRANPDLLHWQVVPSPITPDLPSPTYDEAMAAAASAAAILMDEHGRAHESSSPPSYVTKESPGRSGNAVQEARLVRSQLVIPEMVEIRSASREVSPVSPLGSDDDDDNDDLPSRADKAARLRHPGA